VINSPPYPVYIVEFWRRTLEGREFVSNRIFSTEDKARGYLTLNKYDFIDDNVYKKSDIRAILTERTVE
jgi:hypothetical protein